MLTGGGRVGAASHLPPVCGRLRRPWGDPGQPELMVVVVMVIMIIIITIVVISIFIIDIIIPLLKRETTVCDICP